MLRKAVSELRPEPPLGGFFASKEDGPLHIGCWALISFSAHDIVAIYHAYTLHTLVVGVLALAGKLLDAKLSKPKD
jgi:hypothetical protein